MKREPREAKHQRNVRRGRGALAPESQAITFPRELHLLQPRKAGSCYRTRGSRTFIFHPWKGLQGEPDEPPPGLTRRPA